MLRYYTTLIAVLGFYLCLGQNLLTSRRTSYFTYIYQLSNQEARAINGKRSWAIDDSYFHTLVDSFPTDSTDHKIRAAGHYLKVYIEDNELRMDYAYVAGFQVNVLNNSSDLNIRVYEPDGTSITDAQVKVRGKPLHYDRVTETYRDRRSNQKGLLQVSVGEFMAYYQLDRKLKNGLATRIYRKTMWGTPLKYVWRPVNFVIHVPIDGVKSLIKWRTIGAINNLVWRSKTLYRHVACWFDEYQCDNYSNRFKYKYRGYLTFSRPKYMPGDTVRLKTFLAKRKGRPLRKEVNVVLYKNGREITLDKILPYAPGGYAYEFVLSDTFNLDLDQYQSIAIHNKRDREYIRSSFYYEMYELGKNELTLTVARSQIYEGDTAMIRARGKDENELNLLDGRLEVLVKPEKTFQYYADQVFVPDTLLYQELPLLPKGDTQIKIPTGMLPKVNMNMNVQVTLLTADNERKSRTENLSYYYKRTEIDHEWHADSLWFGYTRNGQEQSTQAHIRSFDALNNLSEDITVTLPHQIRVNPYFKRYEVITEDSTRQVLLLSNEPAELQFNALHTIDSLFIESLNPRNIPFVYYLYKGNHLVRRDEVTDLRVAKRSAASENYNLAIQYLWGGRVQEDNYEISFDPNALRVQMNTPPVIYPGQQVQIEVQVNDARNRPVADADLLVHGLTSKFHFKGVSLPQYAGKVKPRQLINSFTMKSKPVYQQERFYDYPEWSERMTLDSIEYFRFIYPGISGYRYVYTPSDSLTQVAPFVMNNGSIQRIRVISIDNVPVYFSWTRPEPYSFATDSGYHQIRIRTDAHELVLDSVYCPSGKKLILSIDENILPKNARLLASPNRFTDYEVKKWAPYVMPYRNTFGTNLAYFEQLGRYFEIEPGGKRLIGPVYSRLVKFYQFEGFEQSFIYEPYFEYEISPSVIKMRSRESHQLVSEVPDTSSPVSLTDQALTRENVEEHWIEELRRRRHYSRRYFNPTVTRPGQGKLLVERSNPPDSLLVVNTFLFKHDDPGFMAIFPDENRLFHGLEEGSYRLIYLYQDTSYSVVDSISVAVNGSTFFRIRQLPVVRDSFCIQLNRLMAHYFEGQESTHLRKQESRQVFQTYMQEFSYQGEGVVVSGYVYDEDKEPLPGVTILVKGTTFGTISDVTGYYSLKVPMDRTELVYSFVGYKQQELSVASASNQDVVLDPDVEALDEVIVVGYGFSEKKSLTGAVVTVQSTLQGRAAGVSVTGSSTPVMVRGLSTVSAGGSPLIIVDGVLFEGDLSNLDPASLSEMVTLKSEEATALYGARAANGVLVITTKQGMNTTALGAKAPLMTEAFLEGAAQASSIRSRFSDEAFWKPDLTTDKRGHASFQVTFPDDMTKWDAFAYAMTGKQQSGSTHTSIQSFKPLAAQLNIPRFMLQGDSARVIGKALNYAMDTVQVETRFEYNGVQIKSHKIRFADSFIDTLLLAANGTDDSVSVQYALHRADGYFDGEKRWLPVYPVGVEKSKGRYQVLSGDTTVQWTFDPSLGPVTIYANARSLALLRKPLTYLIDYPYSCNEQLASKLKALLIARDLEDLITEQAVHENQIRRIIKKLEKNQNSSGLWGWWDNSGTALWISVQVAEALQLAQHYGYPVSLDKRRMADEVIWNLLAAQPGSIRADWLYLAFLLNLDVDKGHFLTDLDTSSHHFDIDTKLRLAQLHQLNHESTALTWLIDSLQSDQAGNYFLEDAVRNHAVRLRDLTLSRTALALTLFSADSTAADSLKTGLENYVLKTLSESGRYSTYQIANALLALRPALTQTDTLESNLRLTTASVDQRITAFPFQQQVKAEEPLKIHHTGLMPVYLTAYQTYWEQAPVQDSSTFSVHTHLESNTEHLTNGKVEKLLVDVVVSKNAEYVMVEIPIPAGCSYASKKNNFPGEVHREYFREKVVVFCRQLSKGIHHFEVELLPRYAGAYTLNPAKAELMYYPVFYGHEGVKRVRVE